MDFNNLFGKAAETIRHNATEIDRLREEMNQLHKIIARYETRLDAFSASLTQVRADLVPADHIVHHDIARRLEWFVSQDLVGIATGTARDEPAVARIVSDLSVVLFDPRYDDSPVEEVLHVLHGHRVPVGQPELVVLLDTARTLRQDAMATRHGHTWTTRADLDVPADPDRQRVWTDAPADGLVVGVVAPGYLVGDKVYSRQQVFTEHPKPGDGGLID